MRWTLIFVGSLLLFTACGDDAERSMTAAIAMPTTGPGPLASSPPVDPVPGAVSGGSQSVATAPMGANPSASDGVDGTNPVQNDPGSSENVNPADTTPDDPEPAVVQNDPVSDRAEVPAMDDLPGEAPMDMSSDDGDMAVTDGEADPPPDVIDEEATRPEPDVDTPAALSFEADIWPLWNMERDPVFDYRGAGTYTGCSDATAPCHGASNPGAGLSMVDAATAYAQMIDTSSASSICNGTQRIAIGDPEQSCLILFYVGRLGPEDLDWVEEAEIELMREWIRQGALP